MSKQNAPALRLEGFSGEWEKTTLGELGAFRSGVGFPEREQGGTIGLPFYKVSDLSAPGNELQLQSANHYVTEGQIVRNHWTPVTAVPAILFAKVGAAVFLGRKRLVNNAFLLDNNLMAFSLNTESWDVQFADTYLKTVDLTQFTQSGALPSLNARHLAEAEAIIPPTLEEQQAIGAIFTNLDAAINQHTLKHKALQQAKTALMQRMFPQEGQTVPELRLEGFSGEWEPVRLDAFDIKTGPFGSTLHAEDYVAVGTPIVTTEHFKSGQLPDTGDSIPQVSKQDTARLSMYLLDEGDIVFSRVGSVDINAQVTRHQKGWLFSGRVLRLRLDASCDAAFLHSALEPEQVRTSIISRAVGQTMPSINTKILAATEVFIPPTLEEQQAIGAVFTNLDQLIAAEAQYIASLKQAKTALLQRMFI